MDDITANDCPTPGPWQLDPLPGDDGYYRILGADGQLVALVRSVEDAHRIRLTPGLAYALCHAVMVSRMSVENTLQPNGHTLEAETLTAHAGLWQRFLNEYSGTCGG